MNHSVEILQAEELSPEEQYKQAQCRRKLTIIVLTLCVVALELITAIIFGRIILREDLHTRVVREWSIRHNGGIVLKTGRYSGETDFGYFSGDGEFSFNTGSLYNGEWADNKINGLGVLKVPMEGTYEGEFINSQKNGTGTFIWSDGTIYTGEWKNDQMTGHGEYKSFDDIIYSGLFDENAFIDGECKFENYTGSYLLTYKDGEIINSIIEFTDGSHYEGECDGHTITGTGILSYVNGDQYVGSFQDGMKDGHGEYLWISGDTYEGNWDDDKMSGTGLYTCLDGSVLNGEFIENEFNNGSYYMETEVGEYTFTIEDEKAIAVKMILNNGITYEGDIYNGNLTGTAHINYANGDVYDGKVLNGIKEGQGIYMWENGASYHGNWENDKMNGRGVYYYPTNIEGHSLEGTFKNGQPDGECTYYVTPSEHYKTDWSAGKCIKVYE